MTVLFKDVCGVVCLAAKSRRWYFHLHLFIRDKQERHWGYREEYFDGRLIEFGVGPFALFCAAEA